MLAIIGLSLAAVLIKYSSEKDKEIAAVADCVVAQAKAAHYAGNAYSEEAWNLFAGNCK